jgi:hypothetical protein
MTCKDTIINLPILLAFLSILQLENFYLNIPVLVVTVVDEVLFRYLYFIFFSKSLLSILVNGFVYGVYGYFWIPDIMSFLGYFSLGIIFSFSTKKYSMIELCLLRYTINLHCIQ